MYSVLSGYLDIASTLSYLTGHWLGGIGKPAPRCCHMTPVHVYPQNFGSFWFGSFLFILLCSLNPHKMLSNHIFCGKFVSIISHFLLNPLKSGSHGSLYHANQLILAPKKLPDDVFGIER